MRAFLLIVGFVLVAVLSALFAAPVLIDWNTYRGTFEKQATAMLGREVRVGGNANLRLLPAPYLHFDNIRIADQTGRFDNPLIRVEGFTMWLSVSPLLSGAIEAREIELDGPDVRLSVDEDGKANWQGLASGETGLPFLPSEVSLASVKIKNGKLSIGRSGAPPLIAAEAIEGELSAEQLAGPYSFKGSLTHAGVRRDVRISTAALGAEHSLKVKAVVRMPGTTTSYTFDGNLLALDALPRVEGALEAQFGLGGAVGAEGEVAAPKLATMAMRLTSQLAADLDQGALTDLNVTFDSEGRPQLVTGEIGFEWKQQPSIAARLAARWLDLDRISGAPVDQGPAPALKGFVRHFLAAFAANAETRVIAQIDQANLGGDLIGGIALDAHRTPAGIEIASLSAQLPGATTLDVKGVLADAEGAHQFKGPVSLSGVSLAKLLKWAMPELALDAPPSGGFYMIGADAEIGESTVALDNLRLEIDRSRIAGSVRYAGGAENTLTLNLDGDRLDLSEVVTEAPTLPQLMAGWAGGGESTGGEQSLFQLAARLAGTSNADIALSVRELITGAGRLENLVVRMRRAGERIDIRELSLRTDSELALQASGSMPGATATADGLLRFRAEAPTDAALATLDRLLALPEAIRAPALRYALRAPLRVAGELRRGEGSGRGRTEMAIDGSSGGQRVTMSLRGDRSLGELAEGQTDLTLTMEDKDGARLLARLAGRPEVALPAELAGFEPPVAGELTLRASGVPKEKMTAAVKLVAAGVTASFEGDARAFGESRKFDGRLAMTAGSAGTLLETLGFSAGANLATALDLQADIAARGQDVAIKGIDARIDGVSVTGEATLALGGGAPVANLALKADRARLAGLLEPLVGMAPVTEAAITEMSATADSPVPASGETQLAEDEVLNQWTDRPFDLALLEGWDGRLELRAAALDVFDGLSLDDASLKASLGSGSLTLESVEGNALGGAVTAKGSLKREKAGASLALDAAIEGAELGDIFIDFAGQPKAKGRAKASLRLASAGLTPRGLIAVLEGSGEIRIEDGQINGLSPVTVDQAARSLLMADAEVNLDTIAQSIGESRLAADFPIGSFSTKLSVVDGTLRAEQVEISAAQSTVRLKGKLDLDSFTISSDWTLTPRPAEPLKAPLPPVAIFYEGPLKELRTLAAEADVEALERELVARKIIGGEEQLQGLWPDAPPRQALNLPPDADLLAPPPPEEAVAGVPEEEPAETVPGATEAGTNPKKTIVIPKPASGDEANGVVIAPQPVQVLKPKRKVKPKKLTIREIEKGGLR